MTLNGICLSSSLAYDAICLFFARLEDDKGKICSFCGKENLFADDCGWFYIHPTPVLEGYTCEPCFRGVFGQMHQKRYGVGER